MAKNYKKDYKSSYDLFLDDIVNRLEGLVVELQNNPSLTRINWVNPVSAGVVLPMNYTTGKYYKGVNMFMLPPGEYLTFNQLKEYNNKHNTEYMIKKGSHGYHVWHTNFKEEKDEEGNVILDKNGNSKWHITYSKFIVFNRNDIIDPKTNEVLPSRVHTETFEHELDEIKKIAFDDVMKLCENMDIAFYENLGSATCYAETSFSGNIVSINMPALKQFKSSYEYFSALFHEMTHAIEMKTNPEFFANGHFGNEPYALSELVAEMTACTLCNLYKIPDDFENDNVELSTDLNVNTIAYLQGWISKIKEEKSAFRQAASRSSKVIAKYSEVIEKDLIKLNEIDVDDEVDFNEDLSMER